MCCATGLAYHTNNCRVCAGIILPRLWWHRIECLDSPTISHISRQATIGDKDKRFFAAHTDAMKRGLRVTGNPLRILQKVMAGKL